MKHRMFPNFTIEVSEYFQSLIEEKGPNECWVFRPGVTTRQISINGVSYTAIRLAYFIDTGIDPGKNHVYTSCDIDICCNPKHLFASPEIISQSLALLKKLRNTPESRQAIAKRLIKGYVKIKDFKSLASIHKIPEPLVAHIVKHGEWPHA